MYIDYCILYLYIVRDQTGKIAVFAGKKFATRQFLHYSVSKGVPKGVFSHPKKLCDSQRGDKVLFPGGRDHYSVARRKKQNSA